MIQYLVTYQNTRGAYFSCDLDFPESLIEKTAGKTCYNLLLELFKKHNIEYPEKKFNSLSDFVVISLTRVN